MLLSHSNVSHDHIICSNISQTPSIPKVAIFPKKIPEKMEENGNCITKMMDEGSVESMRYYLARKTLLELLYDRGYAVPNSELTRSLPEFRAEFGLIPDHLRLRICAPLRNNPSSKILVIFCGTEEIKKANIRAVLSQIVDKQGLKRIILVLQSKVNHYARTVMEEYPITIETFQITDLLVNVTKHALSPKLELLTPADKKRLLHKHQLQDQQMPRMLENDAVARYYGLEKGQVVRVSYSTGHPNSLVNYRCVM